VQNIPPTFGATWHALEALDLSNNRINTTFSSDFGASWKSLLRFSISNNALHGTVPASFGSSWTRLNTLKLDGNHFSETTGFGQWTTMAVCDVSGMVFACPLQPWLRASCGVTHCRAQTGPVAVAVSFRTWFAVTSPSSSPSSPPLPFVETINRDLCIQGVEIAVAESLQINRAWVAASMFTENSASPSAMFSVLLVSDSSSSSSLLALQPLIDVLVARLSDPHSTLSTRILTLTNSTVQSTSVRVSSVLSRCTDGTLQELCPGDSLPTTPPPPSSSTLPTQPSSSIDNGDETANAVTSSIESASLYLGILFILGMVGLYFCFRNGVNQISDPSSSSSSSSSSSPSPTITTTVQTGPNNQRNSYELVPVGSSAADENDGL
jgi:hypothetical protein